VNIDKDSVTLNYMAGMVIFFSLFQIITIPCIFLRVSFNVNYIIMLGATIVLCMLSFVLNYKRIGGYFSQWIKFIIIKKRRVTILTKENDLNNIRRKMTEGIKSTNYFFWLSVLMIIIALVGYQFITFAIELDYAFYLGTAVTALESNTISLIDPLTGMEKEQFLWRYVLAPFPIFWAFLSRLFNVHPAILVHSILPVVLYLFSVSVFYNLGKVILNQDKDKAIKFLFAYQLTIFFSRIGAGTGLGIFALLLINQGKSILFIAMLPLCFYMYMRIFWHEEKKVDWLLLVLLMLASSMVSSMGVVLGAMCLGVLGISHFIVTRNIRDVVKIALCCTPNVIFGLIFALNNTNQYTMIF